MAPRWNPDAAVDRDRFDDAIVTEHAWKRMSGRRISPFELDLVLRHGRMAHTKGAHVFSIGRKEIQRARRQGADLRRLEGVHVVTAREDGVLTIVTVFRNRDFRCLKLRTNGRYLPRWRCLAA